MENLEPKNNNQENDNGYSAEMDVNDFESALENYLNMDFEEMEEGSIIKGNVVKIRDESVLVDVNFKSEGEIPIEEFQDRAGNINVSEGDEVDVFVMNKNDLEGTIALSHKRAKRMRVLDELEEYQQEERDIVGTIVQRIKGGYTVEIKGIEAFLPGSHVDLRPVPDMDALVGQDFSFRILKINRRRSNVIVSRRIILEEERERQRSSLLQNIEEGSTVTGKVKNITDYGVFIDLGGLDGLLHITDMSWKRIRHPREMLQLGDELELKVISYDEQDQKVSLGLKQLVPNPWENILQKYPEGEKFTGRVTNLVDYGAFVELEPGVEGLVHVSEMSWTRKLRHPSQMVQVGDEVDVVILSLDADNKRISLGMKQVQPNPWDVVFEKYPEGTILEAPIKNITDFGIFIGIEDGIDGLIHVSDLSWTKKIHHPKELYNVGDEIRAKVLTVDKENEKFTLGIKQLTEDPWLKIPENYPEGTTVNGRITNVTEFGVFVEVEDGIEGLVHLSELSSEKINKPSDLFEVDQEVVAKVIRVSADERRLGLSIKQYLEEEEKKKTQQQKHNQEQIGNTLGDKIKQKMEDEE